MLNLTENVFAHILLALEYFLDSTLKRIDSHPCYEAEYDYYDHNDSYWKVAMDTPIWSVAEAKAKFSEVVDKARVAGPQTITKNGRTVAVLVSAEEWERKTHRVGNLAEFFAASPLREGGIEIVRTKDGPRELDL